MYDALLLTTALVIVFLGVRLVMKFREMALWKDDDAIVGRKSKAPLPADLRELTIEEPDEDSINRTDASGIGDGSGNNPTVKKP